MILLSQFKNYLDALNWQYEVVRTDTHPFVEFGVQGTHNTFACRAQVREAPLNQIVVHVYPGIDVPPSHVPILAEFLSYLNYYLALTTFELEPEHRLLRTRVSIEIANHRLDAQILEPLIFTAITSADHYYELIETVVHGEKAPLEALAVAKQMMGHTAK